MKNNKQIKTNKKRTGLYLGLGIGLASLAGATAATLAITFKSKDTLNGKVMFKVGNDHEFRANGSSLTINLSQKTQLVQILPTDTIVSSSDKSVATDFVGWAKASDFSNDNIDISKVLSSFDYVSPATELRAVFKNNVTATGEWHTIKFSKGNEKVILTGNTIVNVLDGTLFQSINKPGCESQAAGGVQKCIGWKKTDGTVITDLTPINGSWEIQPIMSEAATVTFKASSTDAGASIIGTSVVTAAIGTTFDKINIPKVDYSGCTGEKRIFMGWYKKETATWPVADKYVGTTQLTGAMDAVARSIMVSDENFTKINAVQPVGIAVTYQGNTEFAIANGDAWGSYNLPIPVAAERKVSGWQYSYVNSTSATWKDLNAGDVFTAGSTVYIRPVMTSSITSVRVQTEKCSVVSPDCKSKVYAAVYPEGSSQDVTWKIFEDEAGAKPIEDSEYATIDNDGTLLVTSKYAASSSKIYVQATSYAAPSIKSEITKIDVKYPVQENAQFWTFDETAKIWYRLENLNHTTANIEYYQYGSTTKAKSVARSEFNSPVYIGDEIDVIDNNFLYNCTKFNSKIIPTSNITVIRDNFLAGCSSYNLSFEDKLIKTVKYIGDNFLFGCIGFNNNGSLEPIYLQNIIEVGENAFVKCTSFNAPIKFGDSITTINNGFLEGCKAFNNGNTPLTLPSSIKYIGSHFMAMCGAFCQTLQVDCLGSVFPTAQEVNTLSSTSASDPIKATGFKVIGNGAASFPFKDLNGEGDFYRKVEVQAETITKVKVNSSTTSKFKTNYKVGETFTTSGLVLDVTIQKADGSSETKKVTEGFITSIQAGHVFENTEVGTKTLTITYGGVTCDDTLSIKVEAQPEPTPGYGDEIEAEKAFAMYREREKRLCGLIEDQTSNLPLDVKLNNLVIYQGDTAVEWPYEINYTLKHPTNSSKTVWYTPSYITLPLNVTSNSLNVYFSLGSPSGPFDDLMLKIHELTGSVVKCYYNSSTDILTFKAGTESSENGYYVCSLDNNCLITKYNNSLNGLSGSKIAFTASYTENKVKREFIKAMDAAYAKYIASSTTYKTVTFSNDSIIDGRAIVGGNTGTITYETSGSSKTVKITAGDATQSTLLNRYTFGGLSAYDILNEMDNTISFTIGYDYQYSVEVTSENKCVVNFYSSGKLARKYIYNDTDYIDEMYIGGNTTDLVNVKITSWNA